MTVLDFTHYFLDKKFWVDKGSETVHYSGFMLSDQKFKNDTVKDCSICLGARCDSCRAIKNPRYELVYDPEDIYEILEKNFGITDIKIAMELYKFGYTLSNPEKFVAYFPTIDDIGREHPNFYFELTRRIK